MRHLLSNLPQLRERIGGSCLLFLDYDGTLAEIAAQPKLAVLTAARKRTLRKLAACRGCRLAVISGRGLADIRRMVRIHGLIYSGSHGFELRGPGISYRYSIPKRFTDAMRSILKLIRNVLADTGGVILEKKRFSFCIHYRQCGPRDAAKVKKLVVEAAAPFVARGLVRVTTGKKVIEIMPPADWDKGRIVMWLLKEYRKTHPGGRPLPIFIGDDLTDETAFEALRSRGLTCFVGRPRTSAAQYYLKDVCEVYVFLRHLLEHLRDGHS